MSTLELRMCGAERVPVLLAAADFLLVGFLAAAILPHRAVFALFPAFAFLVLYACREYSLFLEFRARRRVGVPLVCVLFLALTVLAGSRDGAAETAVRSGAAAIGSLGWALVHRSLAGRLLSHSCRFTFHLSPAMRPVGAAMERHLGRSRYPARILYDGAADGPSAKVPVEVENPRRNPGDPRARGMLNMDPARFLEETLRVLPPAVLAGSPEARWECRPCRVYEALKRAFDVCGAALLLALSSPLLAFAAVGILVSDGGPVLFRQVRVGKGGKRFLIYKLRSLRAAPPSDGTPNDGIENRAFRFGSFLRTARLDELPQLVNVLRGDMSLIGPRPEMEFFHDRAERSIPFYAQRLAVRPGITGWAQVRFPHTTEETDYWDKTAYDLWYVRHRGPVTDFRILMHTVGVMILGYGAR